MALELHELHVFVTSYGPLQTVRSAKPSATVLENIHVLHARFWAGHISSIGKTNKCCCQEQTLIPLSCLCSVSVVFKQCTACLFWVSTNICFAVQGWLMQIHQPMQFLPPTMRLCWHLCCQCLPVRLSWRVYRLVLHRHLHLLAEGFLILRLVIAKRWQKLQSNAHYVVSYVLQLCAFIQKNQLY